jgi:hypothetical protein
VTVRDLRAGMTIELPSRLCLEGISLYRPG